MKSILKISILLFLLSCSAPTNKDKPIAEGEPADSSKQKEVISHDFSFDTTLVINKTTFIIKSNELTNDLSLLTANGKFLDSIYVPGVLGTGFVDLNKDNYPDLLVSYIGNNPTEDLYLFDPADNGFKKLVGFIKYSAGVQLESHPSFYYSYHRAGCADENWVSDLFKIENFTTIQLGHIYGKGCEYEIEKNPQEIEIYRDLDNDKGKAKLIAKLPYTKNINDSFDKWAFIEKYWNENYNRFR
jgi:hypothetical protein